MIMCTKLANGLPCVCGMASQYTDTTDSVLVRLTMEFTGRVEGVQQTCLAV